VTLFVKKRVNDYQNPTGDWIDFERSCFNPLNLKFDVNFLKIYDFKTYLFNTLVIKRDFLSEKIW